MPGTRREFQIFVKPVGAECNLRCRYCYYLGKKSLYQGNNAPMTEEILENYIIQHIKASTNDVITFSWHGGEPLLAGIDFYRKVVCYQHKHAPSEALILNGIQTNATLLNHEWCHFLAEEKFIVGISIDGPGDMHNINRRTIGNTGSLHMVVKGFDLLKSYGIIPEILCVVNAENVKYPLVIYNFFKQMGAKYITFLPLVEHCIDSPSGVSKNSVPAEAFGCFLSSVFDEWTQKDIGEVKIQIFEEAARTAFDQDHTLCIFKKECGGVPVIERNGDMYSCDHYVDSSHLLGNISDRSLEHLLASEKQRTFGQAKANSLPDYCLNCEVRSMCNGECPKNRFIITPDGEPGLNYLCRGYRYFFNYCRPFVDAISAAWKNQ